MFKKKYLIVLMALALLVTAVGCAGASSAAPVASSEAKAPAASSEAPAAEAQKALLVVSFGTSYNETREATIGAIEKAMTETYKDYDVRRAFTSQIIIDKLAKRDSLEIDNVKEAMDRLVADGVKELVIQPTHVMNGFEYDDMIAEIKPYEEKFDSISYGVPLLTSDEDYAKAVEIIKKETAEYNKEGNVVIFMGHGTEHPANATYAKLQQKLTEAGYKNCLVGTVEATPALEDVMKLAADQKAKKVVLLPFMIVAGDHANNDMAGDEEDSWKTAFKKEGYEVECVLRGLGEYKDIQAMFVEHAGAAMKN